MIKGELIKNVLEALKNSILDTPLLLEAILLAGYGAPLGRIQRVQEELRWKYLKESEIEKTKRNFYKLLHHLNKQGFIRKTNKGWLLTLKGKLKFLKSSERIAVKNYSCNVDHTFKIVIFDIPEKERKKRRWLRIVLRNLKFKFLQKSVWLGKAQIPEEFLDDLRKLELLSYVHIFAISKTGTIEALT